MKKIFFFFATMLLLTSCSNASNNRNSDGDSSKSSFENDSANGTVEINKIIDGFTFEKIETGWAESSRRSGVMFPKARVLVKNTTGHAVKDIDVLQNQFTYSYLENDIIIYDSNATMHSSVLPPWKPDVAKYVELISGPSFKDCKDSYQKKDLWLELFYHDQPLCKIKVSPTLASWD